VRARSTTSSLAYARALENLTGCDLAKLFPTPRIPTEKIPECQPHPETGEDLEVVDEAPAGVPPTDLPPQPAVFAPDYAPEEISQIAKRLKEAAGVA
jgi:Mn-containing catalase